MSDRQLPADADLPESARSCERSLIEQAIGGSQAALRELVEQHRPFVYNLALKMFGQRQDAEDLTQEVFIKAITALGTFRGHSAFRTWLYRITVNHFRKTRRRGMELTVDDFERYFETIDAMPMDEADWSHGDATVEELRLRCTTGMLMCLDREQRLAFLLGAVFGLSHRLGAEVMELSPGNFRVRLHRARKDLQSWMHQRCGLVNEQNPCRCAKKTGAYVRKGLVDPDRLMFNTDYVVRIESLTRKRAGAAMSSLEELTERWFTNHPLQLSARDVVAELLSHETVRDFFFAV